MAIRARNGSTLPRKRPGMTAAAHGVARTQVLSGLSPGDQVLLAKTAALQGDARNDAAGRDDAGGNGAKARNP